MVERRDEAQDEPGGLDVFGEHQDSRAVRRGREGGAQAGVGEPPTHDLGLDEGGRLGHRDQEPVLAGSADRRATLDELLADDVMEPVLRTAGYEREEFREMLTDMAATRSRLTGCYSKESL